jgi:hypothetical protein
MLLRTTVLTAMLGVALSVAPGAASAQQSGLERAERATAHAEAVAGWQNGKSQKDRSERPRGIARVFSGMRLPPGIRRVFGGGEPESQPEPQPEPEVVTPPTEDPPQECTDLAFVDGQLVYVCSGTGP